MSLFKNEEIRESGGLVVRRSYQREYRNMSSNIGIMEKETRNLIQKVLSIINICKETI